MSPFWWNFHHLLHWKLSKWQLHGGASGENFVKMTTFLCPCLVCSVCNTLHIEAPALRWRHNGRDNVSNHQPHDCLLSRLFRRRSKKTSKLRVTGLCAGISPGTGEFPAQMASNAENVSIWWRHHGTNIRHFADDIGRCIFTNKNNWLLIWFSQKFVPMCGNSQLVSIGSGNGLTPKDAQNNYLNQLCPRSIWRHSYASMI